MSNKGLSISSGSNVIVAITSFTSFDIEDAVIMNKNSV